jgi:5-methyltetrahydrofolate corrinoid/iron sulfur protein methyltransferase
MAFVVNAVQEVTDLPLALDTTNVEAIEAGLKVAKRDKGKPIINSVSARPERMEALLPLAKQYDAGIVALLLGVDGIPRDAAERGAHAAELMYKANEAGIANEDIWIDPIVLPVNSQQDQVRGCTEFMMMFGDLAPECRATCGVSNVSNGCPEKLRGILNRTYLTILEKYGMLSSIVDSFDDEMTAFCTTGREDIKQLICRVVDGDEPDPGSLEKEQVDYVKTAKVLLGHSLYSDSWLEL